MTAPPVHAPTSRLVAVGWLSLALPGVGVGTELPKGSAASPTTGYLRTAVIGGTPGRDVPMRGPVVAAECWFPPHADTGDASWARAEDLAERVIAATYNPALMGVVVDLSSVGSYAPARVHTVVALAEPRRDENDPSGWARLDVDLAINWTAETGA